MNGGLLINKHARVSSFGIIEELQRILMAQTGLKRRALPKLGHGGTLDPFATGLLIVCVGDAVKLSRYFLGSEKWYEGVMRFGETTIPGDPTAEISEKAPIPLSIIDRGLAPLQELATQMTKEPYFQTPPMHSAKKVNGRPLYELARQGIEIEREPKRCQLYQFNIIDESIGQNYRQGNDENKFNKFNDNNCSILRVKFKVHCSSGTYVRTLAQDFARRLGTVGMLDSLERTIISKFSVSNAWSTRQLAEEGAEVKGWDELPCWIPFDRLLDGLERLSATREEAQALISGKQNVLFNILRRGNLLSGEMNNHLPVAIYEEDRLVAVASYQTAEAEATSSKKGMGWKLDRTFCKQ